MTSAVDEFLIFSQLVMSLEASFYGGPLLRAAAWNRRAGMHELGAGPTIMSTVATSADEFDLAFVQAAARGETDSVAALIPRVSSIDVLVRPLQGLRTKGRPASALHSAAAVGSEEVVSLLIQNGAEVSKRMHWLRALTPLHVAATPAVAHLLLSAGAQPIALDPREPDPTWYHRVHGREQVAKAIDEWRRAHLNPTPSPPSPRAAAFVSVGPMKTIPALSAAEVKAVASVWSVLHIEAVEAVAKHLEHEAAAAESVRALECSVCFGELRTTPSAAASQQPLICLPCGADGTTPHAFHLECLQRWLLRKATCPMCRSDVRPMLRRDLTAGGVVAGNPGPPSTAPPLAPRPSGPSTSSTSSTPLTARPSGPSAHERSSTAPPLTIRPSGQSARRADPRSQRDLQVQLLSPPSTGGGYQAAQHSQQRRAAAAHDRQQRAAAQWLSSAAWRDQHQARHSSLRETEPFAMRQDPWRRGVSPWAPRRT